MTHAPNELKYKSSHEWVRDEGDGTVTVGITEHAQELLGDIVYIDLPEVGDEISADEEICVVESVKAASDVYAPLSGEVIDINEQLEDEPETVNQDAYGDGWFVKIKLSDPSELDSLLSADDYVSGLEEE